MCGFVDRLLQQSLPLGLVLETRRSLPCKGQENRYNKKITEKKELMSWRHACSLNRLVCGI